MADKMADMTDEDWRRTLTPEQYHVLREKGTEAPGSGKWLYNSDSGTYSCAACGSLLFQSGSKYESDIPGLIGWPSFAEAAQRAGGNGDGDGGSAVELRPDNSLGVPRTEVICKTCGGHLGHLFPDESSPSGQHYCINSAALDFHKKAA